VGAIRPGAAVHERDRVRKLIATRRPQTNNVYGQIVAPDGLRPVVVALEKALGPGCASVFNPRPGAAEVLRLRTDAAEFESLPLPGGMDHVLNGSVAGSPDEITAFVRRISEALAETKIEHTFDVVEGGRVVLSLP
jgi:hypothetical protein